MIIPGILIMSVTFKRTKIKIYTYINILSPDLTSVLVYAERLLFIATDESVQHSWSSRFYLDCEYITGGRGVLG